MYISKFLRGYPVSLMDNDRIRILHCKYVGYSNRETWYLDRIKFVIIVCRKQFEILDIEYLVVQISRYLNLFES